MLAKDCSHFLRDCPTCRCASLEIARVFLLVAPFAAMLSGFFCLTSYMPSEKINL